LNVWFVPRKPCTGYIFFDKFQIYRNSQEALSAEALKMDPDYLPGANHEAFTEWALSQGVVTDAVTPARFPGRGLGMMATRKIKVGCSNPIGSAQNTDHASVYRKAKLWYKYLPT
jgi:hypothetical protein